MKKRISQIEYERPLTPTEIFRIKAEVAKWEGHYVPEKVDHSMKSCDNAVPILMLNKE